MTNTERVLVCGGRDFRNQRLLNDFLNELDAASPIGTIIHGAAKGADRLAGQWAKDNGKSMDVYPADWQRDGRAAGYRRNQRMLDQARPTLVVAFPGGPGTAHMVRIATAAGVPVKQVSPRWRQRPAATAAG